MPGALAFVGPNEAVALLPATQLAINLRARGVQLALLIACDLGVQPGQDVWGSVATGLVGAGVPAVIGMQYKVGVATAIRFDRAFYRALAAGRSVDEAMAAGRLAMYNATTGEAVAPTRARYWRDWAVPVLYLRPGATVSLASADAPTRSAIEDELGLLVSVRANEVKAGGEVVGAKVGAIEDGHLRAELILGDVAGKVTGAQIRRMGVAAQRLVPDRRRRHGSHRGRRGGRHRRQGAAAPDDPDSTPPARTAAPRNPLVVLVDARGHAIGTFAKGAAHRSPGRLRSRRVRAPVGWPRRPDPAAPCAGEVPLGWTMGE